MITDDLYEREDSLRRSFVKHKADFITMDGHTNTWLRNTIAYGQEQNWLGEGTEGGDSQWTILSFRLTDLGKEHFGIKS